MIIVRRGFMAQFIRRFICHRESPYIKAREGYREGELCNTMIDKQHIAVYYNLISQEYNINLSNLSNIKRYLNNII